MFGISEYVEIVVLREFVLECDRLDCPLAITPQMGEHIRAQECKMKNIGIFAHRGWMGAQR